MQIPELIAAVAAAYLIGSIPFAVVVSRAMGLADPRTYGSRNPGATNVLRTGNKLAAVLTLLGDALKGWIAVAIASRYGGAYGISQGGVAAVAVAVFLGHLYPLFLRFQGGKGVATAAGVVLAFSPLLALAVGTTWLAIAMFSRYSSLASIAAAVCAPIYAYALRGFDAYVVALIVIAAVTLFRHKVNIRNLRDGSERRIGERRTET